MNDVRNALRCAVLAATAASVAACGSSGAGLTSPHTTTGPAPTPTTTSAITNPLTIGANYHPKINPAKFTNHITNKYFPLTPGKTLHYSGVRDGQPTQHTFTVTRATKVVLGVPCVVIQDNVTQNHSLVEKTTDWYSQDSAGNVWYFGENTAEYLNGTVTTTAGTWEAGVDKAQPGIVMPATPHVGDSYRQEYRPGVALDTAKILSLNATVHVPAGTFHHVVITFDRNPLDPSKRERKWYASGVGFVEAILHGGGHSETTKLVK